MGLCLHKGARKVDTIIAKAVDEFGGYRLEDDIRDAIQAHLRAEGTGDE